VQRCEVFLPIPTAPQRRNVFDGGSSGGSAGSSQVRRRWVGTGTDGSGCRHYASPFWHMASCPPMCTGGQVP